MIRHAIEEDIDEIMHNLSDRDLSSFVAAGLEPREAIKKCLGPHTWSGLVEGKVACMWGVRFSVNPGEFPTMWLLRTSLVNKHKIEFLRRSRAFAQRIAHEYGVVESCVNQTNVVSQHWLEWLGFRSVDQIGDYIRMRINA
jgi:hypothetical protein